MKRTLVLTLIALVAVTQTAFSQLTLSSVTSTRGIGMAGAGGADDADPANSVLNPAVIGARPHVVFNGFYQEALTFLFDDARQSGFALAAAYEAGVKQDIVVTFGGEFRYTHLSLGDLVVTDFTGEPAGTIEPTDRTLAMTLAAGIRAGERLNARLGLSRKSARSKLPQIMSDDLITEATAYDFGALVSYVFKAESGSRFVPAIAIAWLNHGDDFDASDGTEKLPTAIRYAVSMRIDGAPYGLLQHEVPRASLIVAFDVVDQTAYDASNVFALGAELAVLQVAFLRVGFNDADDALFMGGGVAVPTQYAAVRFDFAISPLEELDSSSSTVTRDKKFGVYAEVPLH